MIEIGRVGLWTGQLDAHPTSQVRELARARGDGLAVPVAARDVSGRDALVSAAHILDATSILKVATGIAQIHARHPHTDPRCAADTARGVGWTVPARARRQPRPVHRGLRKLEYRTPYTDMVEYLAAMDEAPFTAVAAADEPPTVIAALGPKMLQLAATAADGAHPYFSPVEHTAFARDTMGDGPLLAPELMAIVDTDRARSHEFAARHMRRYLQLPNYVNNLLRHGFTDRRHRGARASG
jgi:probable F420-dependent oxidoreductase